MKTHFLSRLTVIPLTVSFCLAAGCAGTSRQARFYKLSPQTAPGAGIGEAGSRGDVAIGVGPVTLPDYLDRAQIVSRVGPNEVRYAEYHRWAERLGENIKNVLAENLSDLIGTDRIVLFPWGRSSDISFQVKVAIRRFEGTLGGDAVLDAHWSIVSGKGGRELLTRKSTIEEPVQGEQYEALVAAQSQALGRLSKEIAEAIESLQKETDKK